MSLYPNSIPRCEHLKVNGTQCGSPALKRNHFCYFHKRWHETRIVLNANRARRGRAALDLPVLEDANSIQVSLMQVMRLILSGQIDPKTAGLLLYALQTASSNLKRIDFEPVVKTCVVIDPKTVDQTPLGEDPWEREDFEDEYEEDDQEEACEPVEAKTRRPRRRQRMDRRRTIPDIDAQAEAEREIRANHSPDSSRSQRGEPRKTEARRPAERVEPTNRNSNQRMRVTQHRPSPTDSRAARGQIRAGQSRFAGTTPLAQFLCLHQSRFCQNRHMMGDRRLGKVNPRFDIRGA